MKNIVGQIPRGDNFYPREYIINKIYRRLDSGSHIFLSAPRRSGKTSIMRYLEDNPKENYIFLYANVEDAEEPETYFMMLSELLLDSNAIGQLHRFSKKSRNKFAEFVDSVKSIKVWDLVEVHATEKVKPKYSEEFEKLMTNLDGSDPIVVLLVDEFPIALERISKKYGKEAAQKFLHVNRRIRQISDGGIRFIYTGSIGLPHITKKLNATAAVNDLNIVEVPPLTYKEALDFSAKLLDYYQVNYNEDIIPYLLEKLKWLMPFYIQLVIQMLIDEYDLCHESIGQKDIDKVFEKTSTHRNNIYFENYYSRLDKSLNLEEAKLAKTILSTIAKENEVSVETFDDKTAYSLLEMLEFDGYINSSGGKYRFNSPILQLWWLKCVR